MGEIIAVCQSLFFLGRSIPFGGKIECEDEEEAGGWALPLCESAIELKATVKKE